MFRATTLKQSKPCDYHTAAVLLFYDSEGLTQFPLYVELVHRFLSYHVTAASYETFLKKFRPKQQQQEQ